MTDSKKTQNAAPTVPSGEVDEAERHRRLKSAVQAATLSVIEREREDMAQEMISMLHDLEKPNPEQSIPDFRTESDRAVPYGTALRTRAPYSREYARLPEEERQWRNEDSDHYMAEWIRGAVVNDRARMLQANEELCRIFGRATSTEGVAGASGALSTGTGGALIPRPLEQVVMIARDRVSKARMLVNVMTMTRQQHTIPTAAAMTAAMAGESTTAAQGEPTMASVALIAKKGQVRAKGTIELVEDAAINVVTMFATRAGGALGVLEDNQVFKDGDGTGNNITKIGGTAYTETTSTILAYSDVLAMYYGVQQEYRDRGAWLVSSTVLQALSNVRDGQGRPFYQGLTDVPGAITDDRGQVGTILRRPVYEVQYTAGDISFGDHMALYTFGSRQGIRFAVSEHVNFETDEIQWKWTERFGGINVDTVAVKHCAGITSATSL